MLRRGRRAVGRLQGSDHGRRLRARNPDARHHRRVDHPAADLDGHGHDADVLSERFRAGVQPRRQVRVPVAQPALLRPAGTDLRTDVVLLHADQRPHRGPVCPHPGHVPQMDRRRTADRYADLPVPSALRRRLRVVGRPDARQRRRAFQQLAFLPLPEYQLGRDAVPAGDAFSESRRDVGHQRSGRRRRLVRPFAVRRRVYRRDDGLHAERPARPRAADHPVHARRPA